MEWSRMGNNHAFSLKTAIATDSTGAVINGHCFRKVESAGVTVTIVRTDLELQIGKQVNFSLELPSTQTGSSGIQAGAGEITDLCSIIIFAFCFSCFLAGSYGIVLRVRL